MPDYSDYYDQRDADIESLFGELAPGEQLTKLQELHLMGAHRGQKPKVDLPGLSET